MVSHPWRRLGAHLRHCRSCWYFCFLLLAEPLMRGKYRCRTSPREMIWPKYAASLEPQAGHFRMNSGFRTTSERTKCLALMCRHYQENVEWEKVAKQGIRFAYIKATQGEEYYDPAFERNWPARGR